MSRLSDLLRRLEASDPDLAKDLRREVDALADRRSFGLNFERHVPEAVELPGRPVRKGDKVRILPPRGSKPSAGDQRLWRVTAIANDDEGSRTASLELKDGDGTASAAVEDLVVVAEFRDPIYPGLVSTGKVERGGDKPFHTVINAENFHALQTLLFTHRGKVDCIYIDPPYNTGAKDWKYNNDYVEGDDLYRHSKWLAFMERRLLLAKDLLNPEDSVLIVTIDEKEYLRLGLLLEQTFPDAAIQMVSSIINPKGSARSTSFSRTDEYIYFVTIGAAAPAPQQLGTEWKVVRDQRAESLRWAELLRSGDAPRASRPNLFYPVFLRNSPEGPVFDSVGTEFVGWDRHEVRAPAGSFAVWPIRSDGTEGRWNVAAEPLIQLIAKGYVKAGTWREERTAIAYLKRGEQQKVEDGTFPVTGRRADGSVVVDSSGYSPVFIPGSQWRIASHEAGGPGGIGLIRQVLGGRRFPFPKSLYAVEDALRFFVSSKPNATVLDFFAGSGTTTHAVVRLNRQDGGRRQSILVTNNEVSADEQNILRSQNLRPGDPAWELHGIYEWITKPRIESVITGRTVSGEPLLGKYGSMDAFPMADGFEENVEFFTLTYESPLRVSSNREFSRVAALLWLRAGSRGRRIEDVSNGWDVADSYGVLADLDYVDAFLDSVQARESVTTAFIVTDEDRLFEAVVRELPERVEPVRLYESYLRSFEIETGRSVL